MLAALLTIASSCGDNLPEKDCTPTTGAQIAAVAVVVIAVLAVVYWRWQVWRYNRRHRRDDD